MKGFVDGPFGGWHLGAVGIGVLGALWAVAGVGFIVATEMLADLNGWQPALTAVTVSSPVVTALDSGLAFEEAALNVAMLIAMVWLRHSGV